MKTLTLLAAIFATTMPSSWAQNFEGLQKVPHIPQSVYYSTDAQDRALKIAEHITGAEAYFHQYFAIQPTYTLLVLSPSDWKKFAHPQAVYRIPHYLPDGRLVVAAHNNDFWKRNTPPWTSCRQIWPAK